MRSSSGQATAEWIGEVLIVALLLSAVAATAGLARPAASVATALVDRMICAVRLAADCRPPPDVLQKAYGTTLAAVVRAHAPEIRFEDGEFVSLPVDPRECRDRACADSSERGPLGRSFRDEPATAFVRVIDCRGEPPTAGADCTAERSGSLYLQYWLYFPDSATRPFGSRGYHRDDWESMQVRIDSGDAALARASSHHGYNHGPDIATDVGRVEVGPFSFDGRRPGWGPGAGYLWVSAGSHAGRVSGGDRFFRSVPADRLRLIPMEAELRSLSALEFEVTPPWLKRVWRDPEHTGT